MTASFDFTMRLAGIVIGSFLMILLGKYDQKKKLAFWFKIFLQSMIAIFVILTGIRIEFLRDTFGGGYWYLTGYSVPATLIWMLIITNSVGQTDEIGEITPTIISIASFTFLIVSLFQRQGLILAEILSFLLLLFSLSIVIRKQKTSGAKENYFSSYYMFFGFMLSIIAIVGVLKSTAALTLLTPLLILGIPIIDTSYSLVSSYLRSDYLGTISESKLKQQLMDQGFSLQGANLVIIGTCIYLSLIAMMISVWENIYLFTTMAGMGYFAFIWLKSQVAREKNIIAYDSAKEKVVLFGVPINRMNCQTAVQLIEQFIVEKKPRHIVTPDTLAILRARKDKKYFHIAKKADMVTPDGSGLLWATTTLKAPLIERITGIDLINQICQLALAKDYGLYLLGSEEDVIHEAVKRIEKKYPGIRIVGYHNGYFESSEGLNGNHRRQKIENEIIQEIKEKKPEFLLVGMGVPKQELWISKYKDELGVPVCIGIGGSFDVISGKIPRAPLWMQNHGMEWIFRLIKEPKRIKRTIALPYFMWIVFLAKIELLFRDHS